MSSVIQVGPDIGAFGFVNRQKATAASAGTLTTGVTTPLNYTSISAIETRLAAINAGYYTATKLNQMSVNDKLYALRISDDPTTF